MGCAPSHNLPHHPLAASVAKYRLEHDAADADHVPAKPGGADASSFERTRSSPPVSDVMRASEQLDSVSSSQRQRTPTSRARRQRIRSNSSGRLRPHQEAPQRSTRTRTRNKGARRSTLTSACDTEEGSGEGSHAHRRQQPARRSQVQHGSEAAHSAGANRSETKHTHRERCGDSSSHAAGSRGSSEMRSSERRGNRRSLCQHTEVLRLEPELVDARLLNAPEIAQAERPPAAAEAQRGTLSADEQRRQIQRRRLSRRQQSTDSIAATVLGASGLSQEPWRSGDTAAVRDSGSAAPLSNPHQTDQKRERIRAWVAVADVEMHSATRLVQARWRAQLARNEFRLMRSCAGASTRTTDGGNRRESGSLEPAPRGALLRGKHAHDTAYLRSQPGGSR